MVHLKRKLLNKFFRFLSKKLRDKNALVLFEQLAARLGIEEVVLSSELGKVQGKLDDRGIFSHFLRKRKWYTHFTEFFERSFKAYGGGTFIDIGANIGLVTIPVANLGDVDCKCFEPEPDNFALLKNNVGGNCPKERCELFPIALYKEESTVELELSKDNRGDHRIRMERKGDSSGDFEEGDRMVVKVPARPLDDVLPKGSLKDIIAIKCDTQGAELGVYLGGQRIFSDAKVLLMEFWPYGLSRMESDPEEIFEKVIRDFDHGLPVYGDERIEIADFVPIDKLVEGLRNFFAQSDTTQHIDFIAVKADLLEKLA